jgi:hypothetical protein
MWASRRLRFAVHRWNDGFCAPFQRWPGSPTAVLLYVDGVLFARREVTLPADEAVSLSFDSLPPLSGLRPASSGCGEWGTRCVCAG